MTFLLYGIHVLVSIFLILVVLLQQGKGADLSVFGGGATMTAFGARGAATLLHKLTVIGFVVFILTTLSIGFAQSRESSGTIMEDVPAAEEAPAAETETPAAETETPAETAEPPSALPEDGASDASAAPAEGGAVEEAPADTATPPAQPEGTSPAPAEAPPSDAGSGDSNG